MIRLLDHLLALRDDAPLKIEVQTDELGKKDTPRYKALSYVGGVRTSDKPTLCNDQVLLVWLTARRCSCIFDFALGRRQYRLMLSIDSHRSANKSGKCQRA
jgi:hypothetical protein